jgi:EAL domain-containing protein (putative c-di-GMP-specific phosphodiesterase class I)
MFDHIDCLDMEFINIAADAIRANRLAYVAKPIVGVSSHQLLYSECVPRLWTESGNVHDGPEFMPALEALGESPLVDRHILKLTLDGLELSAPSLLGCNVSIDNFADYEAYELLREQIVLRFKLATGLVLEINQTDSETDLALLSRALRELKALGCKLALKGFSAKNSFNFMQLAHFDIVKIDAFFMNPKAPSLSETMELAKLIALAKHHVATIVVEGIETPTQERCVAIAGATHIQNVGVTEPQWLH